MMTIAPSQALSAGRAGLGRLQAFLVRVAGEFRRARAAARRFEGLRRQPAPASAHAIARQVLHDVYGDRLSRRRDAP